MTIDWSPFVKAVRGAERFLLTSHARPDCDALGSELGMAGVLESLGKQVTIFNGDPIPQHLTFVDPQQRIQVLDCDRSPAPVDVFIVLDTSAWPQLGPMADVLRESEAAKFVIDHHVSGDDLGAVELKDTSADSTGRLVLQAADALGVELTAEMAQALFAAIATDTGWFRFKSVSGATLHAAGRLVDAGARPEVLYGELYEQNTLARILLRGRILESASRDANQRLISARVTQEDFRWCGAEPGDTEDVINTLLSVTGTEVAVVFTEQPDGKVKVSFRSRSRVDVSQVAERFGGGGHVAAAGATLEGPIDKSEEQVLDILRKAMSQEGKAK